MDIILHQAYDLFPDSKAAKKPAKDGEAPQPAEEKKDEEEISTEAVAMAYLLRGVHF